MKKLVLKVISIVLFQSNLYLKSPKFRFPPSYHLAYLFTAPIKFCISALDGYDPHLIRRRWGAGEVISHI